MDLLLLARLRQLALSGEGLIAIVSAIENHYQRKGKYVFIRVVSTLMAAFGVSLKYLKKLEKCKRYGGQLNDEELEGFIMPLIRANESLWKECKGPVNGRVEEVVDSNFKTISKISYSPDGTSTESNEKI